VTFLYLGVLGRVGWQKGILPALKKKKETAECAEKKMRRGRREKIKEVYTAAILSRKGFILTALKVRNILARR